MFRHVVLFKWKPGTSAETVAEVVAGLTACGAGPAGDAGVHLWARRRRPAAGSAAAEQRFDFAVVADFDDEAAWRAYDTDAEHNRLRAELIRPLIAERVTTQFTVA